MGSMEMDLFPAQIKKDRRGQNMLSDLRLALNIFAWFAPQTRIRGGCLHSFVEIDIDRMMRCWAAEISGLAGILIPGLSMANYFSAELEKGRAARPPYKPYVKTDSIAREHWIPSGEPHIRSLERWKAGQLSLRRYTGNQDLAIGKYAQYRLRPILAGDLTHAYGGHLADWPRKSTTLRTFWTYP